MKGQKGTLAETLKNEYGSFERFKKEFFSAAASTEGSGWAALAQVWLDREDADHAAREA